MGEPAIKHSELCRDLVPIAELIGIEATSRLVRAFGGTEIYIPAGNQDRVRKQFREVLGDEAALILIERFVRDRIRLPSSLVPQGEVRRQVVQRLHRRGMKKDDIALLLCVNSRSLATGRLRTPPEFPSLFDM